MTLSIHLPSVDTMSDLIVCCGFLFCVLHIFTAVGVVPKCRIVVDLSKL